MDTAVTLHVAAGPTDLEALRGALRGRLVRPTDPTYDTDHVVWNTAFQGRPMAIVHASDAGDVATAVGFARRNGLEIAVRSGGHSIAGHSTGDGVFVIDMRHMRGLHVDLDQRIAWAGVGLTAGELTEALAPHGLAVPFGDTGSVGIAGITLGGGIGYLARKYGLAIDSLVAAEIVTAAGDVIMASDDERPDLFWALRGGGGNFGIVTRFCYRLSPVGEVLGGALVLPATRDVLRSLAPIASAAPDELTVIAELMAAPPAPGVPAEHVGTPSVVLLFVYAGDPEAGRAAIEPFRRVTAPLAEMVAPMPYPGIYEFSREAERPARSTARSVFMDVLDDSAVDSILGAFAASPEGTMIQIRVLGGAMGRVPVDATAFAHRTSAVMVTIINMLDEPSLDEAISAWNRGLFAQLEPRSTGVYVNFLEDEGDARVRAAYPASTHDRLVAVKRRYDPTNVFHRNQNIRPD
ncbi:MAG TPA: FAD-binding oxidoreductase [Candidatus Angelobacter sp.]|nr:FAD-binding oxidoreductase [Candidatus Angelobacter sp.]